MRGPARSDSERRTANRTWSLVFVLLMMTSVLTGLAKSTSAAASGPEPAPAATNPLNFAILWHMHQPLYKNVLTGLYEMPWVRDHTDTEYLDHPEILMQYPTVNVTFNLVPSLIYQIDDYANHDAIDNHIQLARTDLATATPDQRRTISQEFIRLAPWYYTNATTNPWYDTYAAFPRLHDLVAKVGTNPLGLNDTELQDLETIYFLRQISIPYVEGDYASADKNQTILDLLHKGSNYTPTDTETVLAIQRTIMGKVIDLYKKAQDLGQAEIITTAYYHPITPLLMSATVPSDDGVHDVAKGTWANDTQYQYQNASDLYYSLFGHRSSGVWSAEQAVSSTIVPYAVDAGFNWTSSDENVLWNNESTVGGQAVGKSVVNMTKVYSLTVSGRTMDFVFRNTDLSNQVSFTYGGMPTDAAVSDFMNRLHGFYNNLTDAQRANAIVSLAADGENWMFQAGYPNDGRDFLNRLYENLTTAQAAGWLKTWKIGDFVSKAGLTITPLTSLHPGSWVDASFKTWSGEEEEQVGWARLAAAREAVVAFTQRTEGRDFVGPSSSPAVKRAWEAIFAAEGSDWFWWYGDDQSSGDDGKFDTMFKAHLITAYTAIGVTPPLDVTATWGTSATPDQPGAVTEKSPPPTVDGNAATGEWANATGWVNATTGDLLHLRGFYAFADAASLYLRIDLNGDPRTLAKSGDTRNVTVYLSYPVRFNQADMEVNLNRYAVNFATANGDFTFKWAARYRLSLNFFELLSTGRMSWSLFTPHTGPNYLGDGGWTFLSSLDGGAAVNSTIEVLVPLSAIGFGPGDVMRLVVVTSNGTQDVDMLPSSLEGPGELQVLIPSPAPPFAVFQDPVGDDVGDGDYTYPTAPDYHCSDGTHCTDKFYDMTYFNISDAPTSVTFTIGVVDIGMDWWNSQNGFSYEIFDIYIDADRVPGSGNIAMLSGPNAEVTRDFAWEAAIQAAGWNDRSYVTHDSSAAQRLQSGLLIRRVPGTMNVEIRVPKALLPPGDPKSWGYVVVSGSQDGYGTDGWRSCSATASTWTCGGAGQPGIPPGFQSRIFDTINATDVNQTRALASYTASTLAKVPGVIVEVKAPGTPTVSVSPAPPWSKNQVVELRWNATPNAETKRAIQSYDVSVFYSPTESILSLPGTTLNRTTFTVSKEQNISVRVTAFDGFANSAPFVQTYEVTKSPPPPPVNHAPILTNGSVSPREGDERTAFLFSVRYVDVDGDAPDIALVLDGARSPLVYVGGDNSTGAFFRFTTTLPAGDHTFKFTADDRKGSANSTVETETLTLHVAAAGFPIAILGAVGVGAAIAAVAVVVYVLWRRRIPPKEQAPTEPPEKPDQGASPEHKDGE